MISLDQQSTLNQFLFFLPCIFIFTFGWFMATLHQPTGNGEDINRENEEKSVKMEWDKLGYDVIPTDYMYIMKSNAEGIFSNGGLVPFGTVQINPHSSVLNYGQGLFEGMKAYRTPEGEVQLFRPEENALRMQMGAERLLMPAPSVEQYVDAVKQVVRANKRWVPPYGKGALYLRPLLFGSGSVMGIAPAPQCTFLIYTNPISNVYKGRTSSLNLLIDDKLPRAYPGGTGGVKNISNYSPVFQIVKEAKAKGFSDVLFLDAVEHKYIEEVSSCNAFTVKGNMISTAPTRGTILPGITRKSIIQLALDLGYQIEERKVSVEELLQADEVFCTGTAVGISGVGSVTYKDQRVDFKTGVETVTQKLSDLITGIQTGLLEDKNGWVVKINPTRPRAILDQPKKGWTQLGFSTWCSSPALCGFVRVGSAA